MDLWTEMGHWVEDDGVDDAPEEPAAANMVYAYPSNGAHFEKQWGRASGCTDPRAPNKNHPTC